jgi:alpha-1,3-mannosyl-glycoprotein beta-1,2-N-acetylglucosaminyltransferase
MVDRDTTLLGASAWNDNGLPELTQDARQLYRSDFFPGLGWLMPLRIWRELAPKWPVGYWDDWLREPQQRKDRHIVRPERCRTYHIGKVGTSNNQFGTFLDRIELNAKFVPFTDMDLSYLEPHRWDRELRMHLQTLPVISPEAIVDSAKGRVELSVPKGGEARVTYSDFAAFSRVAHLLGAMEDVKANVPRTAYKGVVSLWWHGRKIHLVPLDFK